MILHNYNEPIVEDAALSGELREYTWPLILPIPSGTLAILCGALLSHLLSCKPKKRSIGDQS